MHLYPIVCTGFLFWCFWVFPCTALKTDIWKCLSTDERKEMKISSVSLRLVYDLLVMPTVPAWVLHKSDLANHSYTLVGRLTLNIWASLREKNVSQLLTKLHHTEVCAGYTLRWRCQLLRNQAPHHQDIAPWQTKQVSCFCFHTLPILHTRSNTDVSEQSHPSPACTNHRGDNLWWREMKASLAGDEFLSSARE